MVTRFPNDTTGEIVVPLPQERGVQVRYPQDLTLAEWERASEVIRTHLERAQQRRAAQELEPGQKPEAGPET